KVSACSSGRGFGPIGPAGCCLDLRTTTGENQHEQDREESQWYHGLKASRQTGLKTTRGGANVSIINDEQRAIILSSALADSEKPVLNGDEQDRTAKLPVAN